MATSRTAKLKAFRETLPPVESELVICPPDCVEHHDADKPGAPAAPEIARPIRTGNQPWTMMGGLDLKSAEVTAKKLRRHAQRFGVECVEEVAKSMGLTVDLSGVEVPKKKKAPKRPPLRDRALALHRKHMPWSIIEDQLNLSRIQGVELKKELGLA